MKTILVDAVFTFVSEEGIVDEKLYTLLETYPNKKIIVSNADYESTNAYNLCNMPYEVFTLKHKPNKTDPAYFTTLLAQYALTPEEVVYFEHDAIAVESARSVGIVSHHYISEKRDYEALKEFLNANA